MPMPQSDGLSAATPMPHASRPAPPPADERAESNLLIKPPRSQWLELVQARPQGQLLGRSLEQWRELTRSELQLATDRPIVATGHQALLWHPGILAKYLACQSFAQEHGLAVANLVVDQHADGFGQFDIPIRKPDGSLGVRTLELCRPAPRPDVPMGRHEAFTPPRPPDPVRGALPSVDEGVRRIFQAVYARRDADNAALQMALALSDLMNRWVSAMPIVTATHLMRTTMAAAMMHEMVADPWRCAAYYNRAVQRVPEARIGKLLVRDDHVELPLWRIRDDGRRMRAYDNDVDEALNAHSPHRPDLLPRALFMTALARLGMCDLFIHGTGGAVYDRAMELWIQDWLGVGVGSKTIVSADLRLPLLSEEDSAVNVVQAVAAARRMWHDPESASSEGQRSARKMQMVSAIDQQPRNSLARRAQFVAMHQELESLRGKHADAISQTQNVAQQAKRLATDLAIAQRRDWAFPLYPPLMIDDLARAVGEGHRAPKT